MAYPDTLFTSEHHASVDRGLQRDRQLIPNGGAPSVSVVVLTLNEEINLPECLKTISGLNCEIFVVDSGSTDRTREIAEAGGAKVVEHAFDHYAAQRNWAQRTLPIRTGWILHLDADERLTP